MKTQTAKIEASETGQATALVSRITRRVIAAVESIAEPMIDDSRTELMTEALDAIDAGMNRAMTLRDTMAARVEARDELRRYKRALILLDTGLAADLRVALRDN